MLVEKLEASLPVSPEIGKVEASTNFGDNGVNWHLRVPQNDYLSSPILLPDAAWFG